MWYPPSRTTPALRLILVSPTQTKPRTAGRTMLTSIAARSRREKTTSHVNGSRRSINPNAQQIRLMHGMTSVRRATTPPRFNDNGLWCQISVERPVRFHHRSHCFAVPSLTNHNSPRMKKIRKTDKESTEFRTLSSLLYCTGWTFHTIWILIMDNQYHN